MFGWFKKTNVDPQFEMGEVIRFDQPASERESWEEQYSVCWVIDMSPTAYRVEYKHGTTDTIKRDVAYLFKSEGYYY